MNAKNEARDRGILTSWTCRTEREIKKLALGGVQGARLGTVRLGQLEYSPGHPFEHENEILEAARRMWPQIKPSSFQEVKGQKTTKKRIETRIRYLIPATIVRGYLKGRKPRNKGKAIQKAVEALTGAGQPVNRYAVQALIGLHGMEATPRYIQQVMSEAGLVVQFWRARVPFYGVPA